LREAKVTRAGAAISNDQYEPYLIEVVPQEAYRKNAQEIKLIGSARLDEVIEAIEDFFGNEYGKKGIRIEKIVRGESKKIAGLKFLQEEKSIEFEIKFVTYRS
jgi:hypothetical protein